VSEQLVAEMTNSDLVFSMTDSLGFESTDDTEIEHKGECESVASMNDE
jgi:hypothetical protein